MADVLKKFGRYILLDQIAQGGMAEIYRARLASRDGAGRLLVIKRIQGGMGSNNEFLQMFKSEIKVTMGFNHPNIVQLYDFGEEQDQPYIAMEIVDGKNLRQFLNRFIEMKQTFPVELASHIIEQAAMGLHYAHSFKDKISGDHLNIVHRDISPQNILISYEGNVKVIDFGIAKATTNSEHTRAGVIKGKPSYLSPEQISGDPLDGRCDLFALGAVFWELLAGRKLFAGDNDLAVLKMIESCNTTVKPPSTFNPNVPKELDLIVLKILAKSPDKRFQTGEELSRALRRFVNTYAPEFSPADLAHVSKEVFGKEIVEDRKKIQRLNEKVEELLATEVVESRAPAAEPAPEPGVKREDTTTFVSKATRGVVEYTVDEAEISKQVIVERTPPRPAPPVQSGSSKTGTFTAGHTFSGTPSGTRSIPGVYPGSTRTGISRPVGRAQQQQQTNPFVALLAVAAAVFGLAYFGPGFGVEVPVLSAMVHPAPPAPVAPPVRTVKKAPTVDPSTEQNGMGAPTSGAQARLRLNIFPDAGNAVISVNGKVMDNSKLAMEVPVDAPLELSIEREGYTRFHSEFKIDSRSLAGNHEYVKEISLDPERERAPAMAVEGDNFGYLTITSTPSSEATIYVNGKMWGRKFTPFEKLKVPVGRFSVRFYNSTLDLEDKQEFEVVRGQAVQRVGALKSRQK